MTKRRGKWRRIEFGGDGPGIVWVSQRRLAREEKEKEKLLREGPPSINEVPPLGKDGQPLTGLVEQITFVIKDGAMVVKGERARH